MTVTHLVLFGFFTGAGGGVVVPPVPDTGGDPDVFRRSGESDSVVYRAPEGVSSVLPRTFAGESVVRRG